MKRGRKRKQPTYTKTFRIDEILKEFLDSVENSNSFVVETLKNTIEFKEFLQHNNSKDDENQPNLF